MPSNKERGTTEFGAEQDAAAAIAAAKAKKVPIGGVAMPNVPRFDQIVAEQKHAGVQAGRAAQRALTPEEQKMLMERNAYVPGVGAGFAANQPGLSQLPTDAEGNERDIHPNLVPRAPGSGLRPETIKELEAVAAANSKDDEELTKINKEIEDLDDVYETNEFGERVKSLLRNKARKNAIEARCAPMELSDLLIRGSVSQKVPIVPGAFEPTFRSPTGDENLEILRLMAPERGPEQYILDLLSLYQLTAGLFSLNDKVLTSHLDKNGDFNEEMFRAKLKMVRKMATQILADLSVNYTWFTQRVQKLTVYEDIKSF